MQEVPGSNPISGNVRIFIAHAYRKVFILIFNAPLAYLKLPCSPQVLQGHRPLVDLVFVSGH